MPAGVPKVDISNSLRGNLVEPSLAPTTFGRRMKIRSLFVLFPDFQARHNLERRTGKSGTSLPRMCRFPQMRMPKLHL